MASSLRSRSDLVELKRQALEYFSMNAEIPKKVEEALNSLFYESPYDAFGYLSEYFHSLSKPVFISRIAASKSLIYDSKSQPTFRVDLYCQDRNKETKLISMECPCYTFDVISDLAKVQLIQEDDNIRISKLDETRQLINSEINDLIKLHSPFDQDEIDEKLRVLFKDKQAKQLESKETQSLSSRLTSASQPDAASAGKTVKTPTSPKQKAEKTAAGGKGNQTGRKASKPVNQAAQEDELNIIFHAHYYPSYIQTFTSKLICMSSALLSKKNLFEHICDLYSIKTEKFSLPNPMITVLQSGKGFSGKQNLIKEFILIPKPHISIQKGIELITKVNRQLRDTLYQSKQQPGGINKCVTEIGCYTCALDSPQQGLDLIENAITAALGSSAEELSLAINVAAGEIFDNEKNKYEVINGGLKSSDELIELYSDLIAKNPRINMIIEPFTSLDTISWYKLYLKISNYCLIANNIKVNDNFDNSQVTTENSDETTKDAANKIFELLNARSLEMPVNFYKFENMVTLSSLIRRLNDCESKSLYSGLSCSINETNDTFLSDLSVAKQVKFLRIGGINKSERLEKVNRLIEIEQYLGENQRLIDSKDPSRAITFTAGLEIPPEYIEAIKNQEETTKKPLKHKD